MKDLCIFFIVFMIYAIIGWIIEVFVSLYREHKFINKGFLIGPYCPLYGWGGLLITLLFRKYVDDPVVLFILIVLLEGIIEYLTSYFMEKIYSLRWWNYSHFKFNINGRICLEVLLPLGLVGLFSMYVASPFFINCLYNMNNILVYVIAGILFVVYLADSLISESIVGNVSKIVLDYSKKEAKNDLNTIRKEIITNISKQKNYLMERLIMAFPHFSFDNNSEINRKNK